MFQTEMSIGNIMNIGGSCIKNVTYLGKDKYESGNVFISGII